MNSQRQQQDVLLPRLRGVYRIERSAAALRQQQQQLRPGAAAAGSELISKPMLQPRKPWLSWQQQQQQQQQCQQQQRQQQQCQQQQQQCQQQQRHPPQSQHWDQQQRMDHLQRQEPQQQQQHPRQQQRLQLQQQHQLQQQPRQVQQQYACQGEDCCSSEVQYGVQQHQQRRWMGMQQSESVGGESAGGQLQQQQQQGGEGRKEEARGAAQQQQQQEITMHGEQRPWREPLLIEQRGNLPIQREAAHAQMILDASPFDQATATTAATAAAVRQQHENHSNRNSSGRPCSSDASSRCSFTERISRDGSCYVSGVPQVESDSVGMLLPNEAPYNTFQQKQRLQQQQQQQQQRNVQVLQQDQTMMQNRQEQEGAAQQQQQQGMTDERTHALLLQQQQQTTRQPKAFEVMVQPQNPDMLQQQVQQGSEQSHQHWEQQQQWGQQQQQQWGQQRQRQWGQQQQQQWGQQQQQQQWGQQQQQQQWGQQQQQQQWGQQQQQQGGQQQQQLWGQQQQQQGGQQQQQPWRQQEQQWRQQQHQWGQQQQHLSSEGQSQPRGVLVVPQREPQVQPSPSMKLQKQQVLPVTRVQQQQQEETTVLPWERQTLRRQSESVLFLQQMQEHEALLQRQPHQQQRQPHPQQEQQRHPQQQQQPQPQQQSQPQPQPQQLQPQPQQRLQQRQRQQRQQQEIHLPEVGQRQHTQQRERSLPGQYQQQDRREVSELHPDRQPRAEMAWQLQLQRQQSAAAQQQQQSLDKILDPAALAEQLPHCTVFKQLSEEQRAVVFAPFDADLCVVAGPGSGKTRVLAARVALLLLLQPEPVLALTFTRKGAEEMRQRIIAAVSSIGAAISAAATSESFLSSNNSLLLPTRSSSATPPSYPASPPAATAAATAAAAGITAAAGTAAAAAGGVHVSCVNMEGGLSRLSRCSLNDSEGRDAERMHSSSFISPSSSSFSAENSVSAAGGLKIEGVVGHDAQAATAAVVLPQELLCPRRQQRLLLSLRTGRVSVCTFHKFCLQFLRQHASKHLHIDSNFRIATPSEQVCLARNVILRFRERLQAYSGSNRKSSVSPASIACVNSSTASAAALRLAANTSFPAPAAAAAFPAPPLPTAAAAVPGANAAAAAAASVLLQNKNLEAALSRARVCMQRASRNTKLAAVLQKQQRQQQQQQVQQQQQQKPRRQGIEGVDEEEDLSAWASEEGESESSEEGDGEFDFCRETERSSRAQTGEAAAAIHGKERHAAATTAGGGGRRRQDMVRLNPNMREKGGWTEAEELLKLVRRCKRRGCMAVMPGRRWLERSRAKQEQQEGTATNTTNKASSCCYSAAAEEWWQQLQQEHWPASLLVEEYHQVLLSHKPPLLDQSDLIRCTLLLLEWNNAIPKQAARRYPFILVDEFQDTSREQLRILQLLRPGAAAASSDAMPADRTGANVKQQQQQQQQGGGGIMVVGDDDQSIYSFRGIDAKAYPHSLELHLSQNFRCSPAVVSASAALISHNTRRRQKQLRAAAAALPGPPLRLPLPLSGAIISSDKDAGLRAAPTLLPPVLCALLSSPRAEAQYILRFILAVKQHRRLCWCDFAILSRTNRALKELEALLADPTVVRAACFTGLLPYCSALPTHPSFPPQPSAAAAAAPAAAFATASGAATKCPPAAAMETTASSEAAAAAVAVRPTDVAAATAPSSASSCAAPSAATTLDAAARLGPSPSVTAAPAAGERGKQQRRQQNREYWYAAENPPDPALLLGSRWGILTFPKEIPLRSTAAAKLLCGQQLLRRTDTLHCLVYLRLAIDPDHDWSFVKALQLRRLKGVGPVVLKKLDDILAASLPPEKRRLRRCCGGLNFSGRRGGKRNNSVAADEEEAQPEPAETGNPLGDDLRELQLQQQPQQECAPYGADGAAAEGPHSLFRCLCCVVHSAAAASSGDHSNSGSSTRVKGRTRCEKRLKRETAALAADAAAKDAATAAATPASETEQIYWKTKPPEQQQNASDDQQQEADIPSKEAAARISNSGLAQQFTKHTIEQLQRMHLELSRLHTFTREQVSAADVLRFILVELGVEAHIARGRVSSRRKDAAQSKSSNSNSQNSSNTEANEVSPADQHHSAVLPIAAGCGAVKLSRKRHKQSGSAEAKETEAAAVGSAALHDKLEHVWSLLRSAEAYKPTTAEPLGWHCVKRFLLDVGNDFCSGANALQEQYVTRDAVILSTIHQAKGLEWPVVILCRAHEGHLPLLRENERCGSFGEHPAGSHPSTTLQHSSCALGGQQHGLQPHNLEQAEKELLEERRLCYVGMTRAKQQLLVTTPLTTKSGQQVRCSRFILEARLMHYQPSQ